jgi:nicotinate-nucleotide adenylyltransferase
LRIGLFGGSFNPVHRQHLNIAIQARNSKLVDEVWFMPVFKPVHKNRDSLVSYEHRAAMVHIAIRNEEGLQLCDVEKRIGKDSYTVNTLKFLKKKNPEHEFFLIIGGDSLRDLNTWREYETLMEMVEFLVVERPGNKRVSPLKNARIHWLKAETSTISSSVIRNSIEKNPTAFDKISESYLPVSVYFYILRNALYFPSDSQYRSFLPVIEKRLANLPSGLVRHIESVSSLAFDYALKLKEPAFLALLSGLGHDLFRLAPAKEIFYYCDLSGYRLSEREKNTPMLAHGPAAAGFFLENLAETDSRILEALRYHTIPVADMGIIAKILVVADCFDPARKLTDRDALRDSLMNFDRLFFEALRLKRSTL